MNSILSEKLFANITATYSRYLFNTRTNSSLTQADQDTTTSENYAADYRSGIRDFAIKTDLDFIPSPQHFIKFGGQVIHHQFSPGALAINSNVSIDTVAGSTKKKASEFGLYFEDDFKIGHILKINLGAHAAGFSVDDRFYSSLQPRIALSLEVAQNIRWKLSHAWMQQFIHLLTNSGVGLPTDLWVPATARIQPQKSKLSSTGLAWNLKNIYELSIEGYYKSIDGLIEYQDGSSYLDVQSDWQDKVEIGKGDSYGVELFAHRKTGKLSGWIGYTLSWTNRKFATINNGAWFPYRYDRRHDIELVCAFKPKPMKDLSLSWVYGTGNAVTIPRTTFLPPDEFRDWSALPVNYYGERNSFRMRAYHRLDISYTVRKKKKWGERSWTFSAYNLYNRKNPFFLQLDYGVDNKPKIYQYSLFPIIPSISYGFKF